MIRVWYHDNCPDGFTAAWITQRWLKRLDPIITIFTAVRYNEPPPVYGVKDEIFILDFSYPKETLDQIKCTCQRLTVLDHHKTAEHVKDYGIFDNTKSGAVLAWEWFFPHEPIPELVRYVQDRDLWQWALPESKIINDYFGSFEFTFENWDYLFSLEASDWAKNGQEIARYKKVLIDRILVNKFTENGRLTVNSPVFQSELGNELAKLSPDHIGTVMFINNKEEGVYSLRSIGDVDVSVIAKAHGGGGHKNAAGYVI